MISTLCGYMVYVLEQSDGFVDDKDRYFCDGEYFLNLYVNSYKFIHDLNNNYTT